MKNILLMIAVIGLAVIPFFIHRNAPASGSVIESQTAQPNAKELFTGSDDQAKNMISTINPNYKPWFAPLWTPPSAEIESLLFALQGVIGAGVLFYFLGYIMGRSSAARRKTDGENASS